MKLAKHHAEKTALPVAASKSFTPFWPIRRLKSQIDRLFEDPFDSWLTPDGPVFEAWMPAVDVYEDKNNVYVKAEIPGMKKEEFDVYATGDMLNIAGERKTESEKKTADTYRAERYFGRFHRSISLPTMVDAEKISAHYRDGILTVTCPKTEEAKRKAVKVQ